jgi:hypothetical protein
MAIKAIVIINPGQIGQTIYIVECMQMLETSMQTNQSTICAVGGYIYKQPVIFIARQENAS